MADEQCLEPGPGIVSFFSGCGILDLGFESSGFRTWMANEICRPFAEAYEHARGVMKRPLPVTGRVVQAGIETFFAGPDASMLRTAMDEARRASGSVGFIGGPPCPDFSVAGKQAGHAGDNGRLTQDYFDLIGMFRPDFFLFENVRGLISTRKHLSFFRTVLDAADRDGYAVAYRLVNALDYGAPQDRHRVIAVGFSRDAYPDGRADAMASAFGWADHAPFRGAARASGWPRTHELSRDPETLQPLHAHRERPEGLAEELAALTVASWFERNATDVHRNAGDVFRVRQGMAKMQATHEGDTRRKSFKRLHRWRYSPTMAFGNNEVPLHPFLDRRISVAEAMALQSLPREFELPARMTLTDKFKTVGNGVPYLLACGLAASLRDSLGGVAAMPVRLDPARGRTPVPVPAAPVLQDELGMDELPGLMDTEGTACVSLATAQGGDSATCLDLSRGSDELLLAAA